MIYTLYGDYVRHAGGLISINNLVRLLGYFGLSQRAVRSAVSRMKQSGMLRVDRIGGRSYYSPTPECAEIILGGARRIFQCPQSRESWDGYWQFVSYSIPETVRNGRDRLRRELFQMGFGMLTNALWISPNDHRLELEQLGERLDIRPHIEIFMARHVGFSAPQCLANRCWDLPRLNARYSAFVEKYKPMYEEHFSLIERGKDIEPSGYFVRRFELIHQFRRFSYRDPELPAELLPSDWRGAQAATLFRQYHDLLADKANEFFYSNYEKPVEQIEKVQVSGSR